VYRKLRASRGLDTWKPYACVCISPEIIRYGTNRCRKGGFYMEESRLMLFSKRVEEFFQSRTTTEY
jgi:hypothetical protein